MSQPWMKFYPSDWRADPALRMCSLGARGLWMEMLCVMHESEGFLSVNGRELVPRQLAALAGASLDEVTAWLVELSDAGVFSRNEDGTIFSRRMVKDRDKAEEDRATGKMGGNPKLTGGYNAPGYIYLMGVRADGAYKIGISTNPANRLKKVRAQYPGQDIKVLNFWPVTDMGKVEAAVHAMFSAKRDGEWFCLSEDERETLDRTLKGPLADPHKAQKPDTRSQIPEAERKTEDAGKPAGEIVQFSAKHPRKQKTGRAPDYTGDFELWWAEYPRTKAVSKSDAFSSFDRLTTEDQDAAIEGAIAYASLCRTEATPERFICHPAVFLNQRRWETLGPTREAAR